MTGAGEQGESLAARLRRERTLSPALATQTMRGAAATLAGRVHGALTPERLLLLPGPRVEVRDGGESEPAYRAPEQWGGGPADARTDVYTVAVELRCPIALAYSGDLPPGAPAAVEIDEDAPAAGALRDLAGARASAPARRIGGWAALGVLLSGEAVPPSSSPPGGPVLPRAVSILVAADEIRVGTVAGLPGPVERFSVGDMAGLRARLAAIRAEDEFADVLWVEVAAGAGVRWGAVATVLEIARDAGFPVIEPRARDELSVRL